MPSVRRLVAVAIAAVAFVAAAVPAGATAAPRGLVTGVPVDPAILAAGDATTRFVVVFAAKADVSSAARVDGFEARGSAVVQRLIATSNDTQAAARELVSSRGGTSTSYWIRNTMVVDGDADLAAALAQLPGVTEVRAERTYPLVEPIKATDIGVAAAAPEWGVDKIGAPAAWEQGVLGGGVVVGAIDTGVDGQHPALVEQYRGNLGGGTVVDDYNWFDPTGICGDQPCDNVGHGTHTMGTIVGGDGPGPFTPDIGVAPGARWIAAKGCEDLGCSESALLDSGQFMLAPTDLSGANPDPSKRPDIVSNSWGSGPGDPFYQDIVTAWRAAGIIPVFSSGNPGSSCGQGGSPGDFLDAISVGATDIDDVIADFSGRGPSIYGKVNPNVSAPGVDVVSSVPGGGYEPLSGTSMAAPHVSGALALMLSAAPELIGDPSSAQAALEATALDIVDLSCGGDADGDPNNVYGEGRIDALAAVNLVATGGTLEGAITVAGSGAPLAGVRVTASNGEREFAAFTGADGRYRMLLAAGPYTVGASLFGYTAGLASGVEVVTDTTVVQDLALTALPTFVVRGRIVSAESGAPLPRATVTALGTPVPPVRANRRGEYSIRLPLGTYTLQARAGGCTLPGEAEVELTANRYVRIASARKIDDFGHGCSARTFAFTPPANQAGIYGDDQFGRLRLPFEFPFYDATFTQVFVSTNGLLTMADPGFAQLGPGAIPSANEPNGLIAPMWGDLVLDEESEAGYRAGGAAPNRWFTVSIIGARNVGTDDRFDYQVRLWENGTIDMIYRDNGNASGDGSRAAIGLESPDGSDGFPFSSTEAVVTPNASYRFEVVPTGVVSGVVTNANDGLPVAGVVVTAEPGGRSAVTDADGRYSLRLVPGTYTLTAAADDYVSSMRQLRVRTGGTPVANYVLDAASVAVTPAAIDAAVELGATTTATLTVTNEGTAALEFEMRERDQTTAPVELPAAVDADGGPVIRPATWDRFAVPAGASVPSPAASLTFDGVLETIVDDPDDDAVAAPEITALEGGSDGTEFSVQFDTADPISLFTGYLFIDVDQDVTTGFAPSELFGLPTQELGVDYFVDMFGAVGGTALLVDGASFEVVAELPVVLGDDTVRFDVPLGAMGDTDGLVDVASVVGDDSQPTDWVPDEGKGTIEPFRDAPWMSLDPEVGTLAPGASTDVTVTLGGVDPGAYTGFVVVASNDPRQPQVSVAADLEVTLPDGFGAVTGTVTNSRAGFPIPATIAIAAERGGAPYPIERTADDTGTFTAYGPAGTWPVTVSSEGYQDATGEVTFTAGDTTTFDVALDPLWPFATVEGGPIELTVAAGESSTATLELGNAEGLAPLAFQVDELAAAPPVDPTQQTGADSRTQSDADVQRTRTVLAGNPVLLVQDVAPWGTASMEEALELNGAAFDTVGSADLPGLDLSTYEVVIVANDQTQAFYDVLATETAHLTAYVEGGGFLWLGLAGWGSNDGDPDGQTLPGGGVLNGPAYEAENDVTAPDHPVVAGVPDPFPGAEASHGVLQDLPAAATVIATTMSGEPTLAESSIGSGRVLMSTQPVEFGWQSGEDTGTILANAIPYALGFEPFVDIPWLSVDPSQGSVAAGGSAPLTVTLDASALEPGAYAATIVITTDDPVTPRLTVPVTLTVVPAPSLPVA